MKEGKTMNTRRLAREIGGSIVVSIPKKICEEMGIKEQTLLNVQSFENKIIMTPEAQKFEIAGED